MVLPFTEVREQQREPVYCEDIKRPYLCDKAETIECCLLAAHQGLLAVPVQVFIIPTSEVGSAVARPTPRAFVMWNEKEEGGRRASSSGRGRGRRGEKRGPRNPSGGKGAGKGEVQSCCRGVCNMLMENINKGLELF